MGCSRIRQFEVYVRKVFRWPEFLSGLQDRRNQPRIPLPNVICALIYGTIFRQRALAEIERECRQGFLKRRVGPCSDDTLSYALDHLDPDSLRDGWHQLSRLIKRNGMIRSGLFGSLVVGVLDGIETLSSFHRHCPSCLERRVTVKEKDGSRTVVQYYHRSVVLCLIGYDFPIPLELEPLRPGEGEVDCALRLLSRVRKTLGSRFLDGVVADSLYCSPAFFAGCADLDIAAAAVLKANQPSLLAEALQLKTMSPASLKTDSDRESVLIWDLPQVDWVTADQDVRVILAERTRKKMPDRRPEEREKYARNVLNAFVFSADWPTLPTLTAFNIGRHRWDVDAALFQDLTLNWNLKHPTAHFDTAYLNILMIRLIAYLLAMSFFWRHINSRRNTPLSPLRLSALLYQGAAQESDAWRPLLC